MKNEITAKRLQIALSNKNMKPQELCDASGVSKSSISQYINGSHCPSNISSGKMGKILNVNPLWLMGFDVQMNVETDNIEKKGLRIPVLGSVPAGVPIEAIEDIIDYEDIDSVTASKGEYFGLKVKGHSMEPRICEGDVLIVKKQDDCESGDTVIVMVNGNDATVKRLMKYADGIRLIPNNPTYEPMYFTNEEIINKPVKIIGKVVENRQKY